MTIIRALFVVLVLAAGAVVADAGSISGTVTLWGNPQGGQFIEVGAHSDPEGPPDVSVIIDPAGGAYSMAVPDGTYYVAVVYDRDGLQQEPDVDDIFVWYDSDGDGDPDTVNAGTVAGVDVDLGYVYADIDAGGGGNGTSWADAYTDLNAAIQNTPPWVELWVAEGTYVPGPSRSSTFLTKSGVRVYGGFSGTETLRSQRDIEDHRTVLSGEIGAPGTGDNCYHVVNVGASFYRGAMLNGFTITAGRADGAGPDSLGGGVLAQGGGAILVNIAFVGNYASISGGGLYEAGGYVPVYNSMFLNNSSGLSGGGYRGTANGQPLVNCVFTANSSFRGGAIAIEGGSFEPDIANVSAFGNTVTVGGEGPGLWANNSTSVIYAIDNSIFWGNTGGTGAQITFWTVAPAVRYSIVEGGYAGPTTQVLDLDPQFIDPDGPDDILGTLDDDLDLDQTASPAIDAADNDVVPEDLGDLDENHFPDGPIPVDIGGRSRFSDMPDIPDTGNGSPPIIDMGAFEAGLGTDIFEDGFESGDTSAWSSTVP
jgi:hypothetical protein